LFGGGPALLPRPTQGTSQAETRHRLLTKLSIVSDKILGPWGAVCKVLETSFMFESSRKLPRISQPGPRTTSCWCSIHQHTSLAADAVSGGRSVPAAKFMVDYASRIKKY